MSIGACGSIDGNERNGFVMNAKRIITLIVTSVLLFSMISIPSYASDGKDYEVVVSGYIDSSVKYNNTDTYRIDFKIKTLNDSGVANTQSLKIAFDTSVLKLINWAGADLPSGFPALAPESGNLSITTYNAASGHDGWSKKLLAARNKTTSIIYLLLEPQKDAYPYLGIPNYVYPALTTIQSVRFAFQSGKGFADMKSGTIRFPDNKELLQISASCQLLICDGVENFSYGTQRGGEWRKDEDKLNAPLLSLELPEKVNPPAGDDNKGGNDKNDNTGNKEVANITAISANPSELTSSGGISVITVKGANITTGLTIRAFDGAVATSISALTAANGVASLTFPKNTTAANKTYTIKASPDSGTTWAAATASVTVTKSNASVSTDLTGNNKIGGAGTASSLPGTAEWTQSGGESWFLDANTDDWFYNNVRYVYQNKLMNGTSDSPMLFSPNNPLTRGMVVTILYRHADSPDALGSNLFSDVPDGQWYTDAVTWAAANQIVFGIDSDLYAPNANVTREQLTAILYRYARFLEKISAGSLDGILAFADTNAISDYAKDAVLYCYVNGIVTGKPGNLFDPKGSATRAEAAAMFNRFIEFIALPDQ